MPLSNDMEDKIAINLLEISDCFVYQVIYSIFKNIPIKLNLKLTFAYIIANYNILNKKISAALKTFFQGVQLQRLESIGALLDRPSANNGNLR